MADDMAALLKMHDKRMRGFRAMGYSQVQGANQSAEETSL